MFKVKALLVKICGVAATYILGYRAYNTSDYRIMIVASLATLIIGSFTIYILFENLIKSSLLFNKNLPSWNKKVTLKYHYYQWDIFSLAAVTLGCYFVMFVFVYATVTGNNPFMLWGISKYLFYLVGVLFAVGCIYFTIQLLYAFKKNNYR